jgi:hypothetical protein
MKRIVPIAVLSGLTAALVAAMACGSDQKIESKDAGTSNTDDAGVVTGKTIKVTYQGSSIEVALNQLATVDVNGTAKARLSAAILAALPSKTLEQIQVNDLIASDGYTPTAKSNCAGMLPVAGPKTEKGYVDPSTRLITWDESLAFPGCMKITDAAEIVVADAEATDGGNTEVDAGTPDTDAGTPETDAGVPAGKILKVTYGGSFTNVDLNQPTAVDFGGESSDKLSDVVALGVTGKTADQLQVTGIIASDGFNPATRPSCQANFPIDGAKLAQGYIGRESRNVSWDASLAMPGCVGVDDTVELIVEDKPAAK